MASLLAARRKHLAATLGLHAHAKTVRLGAPAFARLIGSLWQSNPPLCYPLRVTCYVLRAARTVYFVRCLVRRGHAVRSKQTAVDRPQQQPFPNQ